MNIIGLVDCLEFVVETQELRKLGLTEEEVSGYFEFDWDLGADLITSIIRRGTDDKYQG